MRFGTKSHNDKIAFYKNGFQVNRESDCLEKPTMTKMGFKTRAQKFSNPQAIQRVRRKLFALPTIKMGGTEEGSSEKSPKSPPMRFIIDHVMRLQYLIMQQGETLNHRTRLQLMIIMFQAALSIVFNVYNLVMYFLEIANDMDVELNLPMTLLFYVYLIFGAASEILITIVGFSMVYGSVSGMVREVNHLLLYMEDDWSRNRLSQFSTMIKTNLRKYTIFHLYTLDGTCISAIISGTTTYIIILVQYSDSPEIVNSRNQTMEH